MTNSPSPIETISNVIAQKLQERSITAIALVDDAYDPLDQREVTPEQVEAFWSALSNKRHSQHTRMREEFDIFTQANVRDEIRGHRDIDQEFLEKLWDAYPTFSVLTELLDELFSTKLVKQKQLERIRSLLSERCKNGDEDIVQIKTLGSQGDVAAKLEGVSIVFLDYHMGADASPQAMEESIERAQEITKSIYDRYASSELPLIVLMSNFDSVKEYQDKFRRASRWLNGLFYCVTKKDLEDAEKIGINLGTWIERLEEGKKIQQFVNSVEDSLQFAFDDFVTSIRNLSLEDYAYVQNFSLAPDGQPLGEYVLWLFNSYLGRMAFENSEKVNEQQSIINKVTFERLPLNQLMPSPDLIEMYDSALFNKNVGDISKHPSLGEEQAPPTENHIEVNDATKVEHKASALPYLRLGLLFVKDDASEVKMVINADCDLAYTPDGGRPAIQVVALITGELNEIKNSASTLKEPKTDFFKFRDKSFYIGWQVKKISFYEYAKVLSDLVAQGYKPHALLRLPYALEVQRAYAWHFARIGVPVAPPISHDVSVEILYKDTDNQPAVLLEPMTELASLMTVKDKDGAEGKKQLRCRFTTHFGHYLRKAIINLRNIYIRQREVVQDPDPQKLGQKRQKLQSKVEQLDGLIGEFDNLFLGNPSPDLLGKKSPVPLYEGKNMIGVYRNIDKGTFEGWGNYFLLVNLIDTDCVVESNVGAEGD